MLRKLDKPLEQVIHRYQCSGILFYETTSSPQYKIVKLFNKFTLKIKTNADSYFIQNKMKWSN